MTNLSKHHVVTKMGFSTADVCEFDEQEQKNGHLGEKGLLCLTILMCTFHVFESSFGPS